MQKWSLEEQFTSYYLNVDKCLEGVLSRIADTLDMGVTELIEEGGRILSHDEYEQLYDELSIDELECIEGFETDMDDLYAYVDELLPGSLFLQYGTNLNWRGSSGFKVVSSVSDAIKRHYDTYTYLEKVEENYVEFKQSSHDVPTGSLITVVRLNPEKQEQLNEFIEEENMEAIEQMVNQLRGD